MTLVQTEENLLRIAVVRISELEANNAALQRDNIRMSEALKFYANEEGYSQDIMIFDEYDSHIENGIVITDAGQIARTALESENG